MRRSLRGHLTPGEGATGRARSPGAVPGAAGWSPGRRAVGPGPRHLRVGPGARQRSGAPEASCPPDPREDVGHDDQFPEPVPVTEALGRDPADVAREHAERLAAWLKRRAAAAAATGA